jgi:trans-aconitate methyltransferase
MKIRNTQIKPAEAPSRMEPLRLDSVSTNIADLAAGIAQHTEALASRFPPQTLAGLAEQVLIMNCYYSNLIEGHPTRPHDIDAALKTPGRG